MIIYEEFIKGLPEHKHRIAQAPLFEERSGMKRDCYYPVIPALDDDPLVIAEIMQLEQKTVNVCEDPEREPVQALLYVEGEDEEFGYRVTVTED